MKITIEGFDNKDQVNEFIHWMCNSGEQDFMTSFECSEFWTGTYPSFEYEYPDQLKKEKKEYKIKISFE